MTRKLLPCISAARPAVCSSPARHTLCFCLPPLPLLPLMILLPCSPHLSSDWLIIRKREANTPSRGKLVKTGGQGMDCWCQTWQKKKNPGLIQYHTWISVWKALHHSAPRGAENRGWMLCLDHVPSEVSGQFHWNAPSTVQKCIRVDIDSVTLTVSVSMSHSLNMFVQVMWSLTSLPAW